MELINAKSKKRSVTLNDMAVTPEDQKPKATGIPGYTKLYKEDTKDGIIKKVNDRKVLDSEGNPTDGSNKFGLDLDALYGNVSPKRYKQDCDLHNAKVKGKLDPRFGPQTIRVSDEFIIVRALWEDNVSNSGIYNPPPQIAIPNMDDSKYMMKNVDKQFPFINIVRLTNASINTLEFYSNMFDMDVEIGDYLLVSPYVVEEQPKPGTKDTWLPASFAHPDSINIKVADQFGYLMIRKHEVQAVLIEDADK